MWTHLSEHTWALDLVQALVLTGLALAIYRRFIQKTHVEHILRGLALILLTFAVLWGAARLLHLPMLEAVFAGGIQLLFIAIIIIFQPELRRMLLVLGQGDLLSGLRGGIERGPSISMAADALVKVLIDTLRYLSRSKTGALIVLEMPNASQGGNYLEAGTPIDAEVTLELMLTIFKPTTPLHDGAVVIDARHRLAAAGVLLPLTEDPKLSWQFGTRHRAAIGLTEVSDSYCLVVSEETGHVSLAFQGKLERFASLDELKTRLERIYHVHAAAKRRSESMVTLLLPDTWQRRLGWSIQRSKPDGSATAPLSE